jgi:hypothetical protein
MRGSASPIVPSPSRTDDRGASTEIAPSRGIHGVPTGGLPTQVLPPLCALHLRRANPPDPTDPSYEARVTTTPAQYPIGWIHQHRQRLPAGGAGSSAEAKSHHL